MGYPKKHRGRRKQGSKKEELKEKIKKNSSMEQINKVKSISIWIFVVPFLAVNACLIINNPITFFNRRSIQNFYAVSLYRWRCFYK